MTATTMPMPTAAETALDRPVRVLQVVHSLQTGGAETLVYDLATANRDLIKTAVVCLDSEGPMADRLRNCNIPVHHTHRRGGLDLRQVSRIARIIHSFEPDVVHSHQYTPFLYGSLACLWAGLGCVLFTEHGRHFPDLVGWKRRMVNRFLAPRTAHVTAVCEFTRERLVRLEGMSSRQIEVVYNGIDLSRFEERIDRGEARRRLGLPNDAAVIVQVGTFRSVKDHPTALRAFQTVIAAEPSTMLVFAGQGPDLPVCRKLAARLDLNGNITFLGQRSDIVEILAAADIMLLTSVSEAHSLALLEGMAAALPVVATNVGGIPETVIDNETALLVPPGDPDATATAMLTLLRQPALRKRMGEAGCTRVREYFSQTAMHKRYMEIYGELARRGAKR